jgi:hypothetical protein
MQAMPELVDFKKTAGQPFLTPRRFHQDCKVRLRHDAGLYLDPPSKWTVPRMLEG